MAAKLSPCQGCTERFLACSDNCPKDARGDYGYQAWKADINKIKQAEREYKLQKREEYIRSERCEIAKQNYAKSKKRKN